MICVETLLPSCFVKYDRRMFTYESEELHHVEPPMIRLDPGFSPHDKSHRALEIACNSSHFDNDFGDGMTLLQLRDYVRTNPFPIRLNPRHDWYSGVALADL